MEELMPPKNIGVVGFFIGFATGSLVSLLYAPKSGKEFRTNLMKRNIPEFLKKAEAIKSDLVNKAKSIAFDISERSERLVESSKKIAEGKYSGTVETLEKEYNFMKNAIDTAINSYKRNRNVRRLTEREVDDLFIDFEDEVLPKFVRMGKRGR
jgi:gas vesicle protein